MPSLVILGAGGFVGKTLIAGGNSPLPIKAVARKIPPDADLTRKGVNWLAADLLAPSSLHEVLAPGDVVMNLAYMSEAGEAENVRLIDNAIQACLRLRAARLVHCSTAIVAGATRASRVLESTPCEPRTPYERTKWALEQRVLSALSKELDVGILRPTAILGPGGQNLLKLARSLQNGSPITNYLRACLFDGWPMHLVPVRNVAAALLHLAILPGPLNGNVYHASSDDDPDNHFSSVEEMLLRALGQEPRRLPLLPVPPQVLTLLLRLLGRSDTNMARHYDSTKLLASGLVPLDSVADAVREFGESHKTHRELISQVVTDDGNHE